MNKMQCKIRKAKESALGRVFCRLFGDEGGAVMMEYVVIAVLIAAAAVAVVTLFGGVISDQFIYMVKVITDGPDVAKAWLTQQRQKRRGEVPPAQGTVDTIQFQPAGTTSNGG